MINTEALFKISYGLYIVCSGDKTKGNGFISNSVFQVSSLPAKFAVCCSKDNYSAEVIKNHNSFTVSVLEQNTSSDLMGTFGYNSGRDIDKIQNLDIKYGDTNAPIVLNESIAYLECKVIETIDVGSHLMYIGELLNAEILDKNKEALTYDFYRNVKKGKAPKNAPTYIDSNNSDNTVDSSSKKYECSACGYEYDKDKAFEDLPDDWSCPVCGAEKSDFMEM